MQEKTVELKEQIVDKSGIALVRLSFLSCLMRVSRQ